LNAPRWLPAGDVVRPRGVPDDAIVRVLRVPPEEAGVRLDVFLSSALRNTSRTRAKLIAAHSAYCPEGRHRKPSERLHAEDRIVLWRRPVDDADPDIELPVLYDDAHLVVLNKPPHLAVHPTARHHHATVTKILQQRHPTEHLRLVHRLDRETSGVLLVARGPEAERAFKMLFEGIAPAPPNGAASTARRATTAPASARRQRLVEKEYTAICWGSPPNGLVDAPLEPDPDNPLRVKMRLARGAGGLSAQTRLHTLEHANGYSLVRCELLTGRQHQIRIHLAHLGCPVVGDKLYGPDDRLLARAADGELTEADLQRLELPRHALHASRYRLAHPLSGAQLDLIAPLAPDLASFWRKVSGSEAAAAPKLQGEGHQALVEVLTK
jgi:23S rRNA pseudouridine1911/1915/1917 synthase